MTNASGSGEHLDKRGPWGNRDGTPEPGAAPRIEDIHLAGVPEGAPPELVDMVKRHVHGLMMERTRPDRFSEEEASDMSRAAADAVAKHMDTSAPECDYVIFTSAPYRVNKDVIGNSICQRIHCGELFRMSLKRDVVPRLANYAAAGSFKERVKICWRILFGGDKA